MENMEAVNPRQSLMNKLGKVSKPMEEPAEQNGGFPKTFNTFEEFAEYAKSYFSAPKEESSELEPPMEMA